MGGMADMATCVIVGSPETRVITRANRAPLVYSPRFAAGPTT
jgi:precorrin-3B C17-methyltransferase